MSNRTFLRASGNVSSSEDSGHNKGTDKGHLFKPIATPLGENLQVCVNPRPEAEGGRGKTGGGAGFRRRNVFALGNVGEEKVVAEARSKQQGYDINQDIVAPNSIRESPLLETARIKLDNLVSLVSLFTKLALNTSDLMLDECFLLPNQVRIPQLQFVPSRTMIALPLLPYISLQLICETFKFRLQIPIVESDVLATELEVTLVADVDRAAAIQRCKNVRLD
ncbi:mediator complex, 95kD-subunit [Culex quinquefasciatus]|uniref:Mediator complex, 95kD-subunit n=1 Tax=Culex quinquefasciatus TaxID=7176 RepID=B0W7W8_CULQU|nr:mediator complex, 95kD-subunit [Culex quinquefasciatus]|eukprot:XP_001844802.1 mediator complex, 95kD-subunit [Culex quinquefasciatus]